MYPYAVTGNDANNFVRSNSKHTAISSFSIDSVNLLKYNVLVLVFYKVPGPVSAHLFDFTPIFSIV